MQRSKKSCFRSRLFFNCKLTGALSGYGIMSVSSSETASSNRGDSFRINTIDNTAQQQNPCYILLWANAVSVTSFLWFLVRRMEVQVDTHTWRRLVSL